MSGGETASRSHPSSQPQPGPVQAALEAALDSCFRPSYLEVLNESYMHAVPPGSESHFRITLVSSAFAGEPLVRRHRQVYKELVFWLSGPVHALALHTYTPDEWEQRTASPTSPECLGGGRS